MDGQGFIAGVADRLHCDPRHAEALTFVVLQELRDQLTPHEVAEVAAQLPPGLRLLWTENESPERPVMRLRRREFLRRVRRWAALGDDREAERAVRAVFAVLLALLPNPSGLAPEGPKVLATLPKEMKTLWGQGRVRRLPPLRGGTKVDVSPARRSRTGGPKVGM